MPDRSNPRDNDTTAIRAIEGLRPATKPIPRSGFGRLVCVVGHEAGRSYPLGSRTVVIGRAADATISLSGDDISRHHASVSFERDTFILDDLGSSNRTLVNGAPVARHVLALGDRIQIAESATLVFARHDDLEQRALQFQKLETLGRLAGGLAHDFRNVVNVIVMTTTNLQVVAQQDGQVPLDGLLRGLGDIQQAAAAANAITGRLLCFARGDYPTAAVRVALSSLVEEITRLIGRTFGVAIDVVVDVPATLAVRADAAALHQVLMNLCVNARDAMPDGGRLTFRAFHTILGRHDALEMHLPSEGEFVELTVSDTGVGMDEATRARVFEPFFTTKPAGEGTGLGLFSVFGIVRALGGGIAVESEPGRGTRFRVLLRRT